MTIPEILKELEPYTGRFPMEAMRTAIEHREAMTPELLRVVEAIAANPAEVAKRDDYMLPVFALYLLAQFREKRAYPAIVKMFSAPGTEPAGKARKQGAYNHPVSRLRRDLLQWLRPRAATPASWLRGARWQCALPPSGSDQCTAPILSGFRESSC